MKLQQLVKELNSLKIKQEDSWENCIPDEYLQYFRDDDDFETFDYIDDVSESHYTYFTTVITVIKLNNIDGFLGIKNINIMSKGCDHVLFDYTLSFYEMEEYPTTSYKIKNYENTDM